MERENFIELLKRSSPNDIRSFLERNGKRKRISPFIKLDENSEERRGIDDGKHQCRNGTDEEGILQEGHSWLWR